jgi:hypothetical protein
MTSWLLLGFTMGLRHALEADHLAAVASLSAGAASPAALLRIAGAWGIGHGLVIVAIASLWVATGVTVPDQAQPVVEAAAGLLLLWLGVDLLRERGGAHASVHEHRGGIVHAHLHWRPVLEDGSDREEILVHPHTGPAVRRSLFVGSLHGLGGSALLGLLAGRSTHAAEVIAYAAVFGLGATAGMLALSTTISFPLRWPQFRAMIDRSGRVAVAAVSIAIGIWIGVHALLQIDLTRLGL